MAGTWRGSAHGRCSCHRHVTPSSATAAMTSVGKVNQAPSLLLLLRQGLALEPACFQSAQLWVAEPNPNGSQPCPRGSAPRVPHPARCPSQEPQPSAFGLAWGRKEWCKCNTASGKSCWRGAGTYLEWQSEGTAGQMPTVVPPAWKNHQNARCSCRMTPKRLQGSFKNVWMTCVAKANSLWSVLYNCSRDQSVPQQR